MVQRALSASELSNLTTAREVVVSSLSLRSPLQSTLPSLLLLGFMSPGSFWNLERILHSWWQKRVKRRGLFSFLLAELQQLHSILCCQRTESNKKRPKPLSECYHFIPLFKLPDNEKKQIMKPQFMLGTPQRQG